MQLGPRRPWIIRYGSRRAVLRAAELEAARPLGFSLELLFQSFVWLHELLRDLALAGFVAPSPVADLGGKSVVVIDDAVWELLSFVPGEPIGWSDHEIESAGRLLGRLHTTTARLPERGQRPGALTLDACRPREPFAAVVRAEVERQLVEIGHADRPRSVVHGDATQANVVANGASYSLVDYAIAYVETPLFDIASALWRNGRTGPNDVRYDPRRSALFVRGYHLERPLRREDTAAIVTYMKARGLQLQHRLERRNGTDETVLQRLAAVRAQEADLSAAIEAVIAVDGNLVR